MEKDKFEKYNGRDLIIFGAGYVGKYILHICQRNAVNVAAFCDNRIEEDSHVENLPVYRLNVIKKKYKNPVFIIAIRDLEAIIHQILDNGYDEWLSVCEFYNIQDIPFELSTNYRNLEIYWYRQRYYMEKNPLKCANIDFVVTEKCSLKCRECSNLMQYYRNPQNFSFVVLKKELDQLLMIVDEIFELRIIGGEPFMNPDIYEIISYAIKKKQIKRVVIYTNGTILPNAEQMNLLRNSKIWFSISDYGKLSRNLEILKEKLQINKIGYECKKIDYWTKCSSFIKHDREVQALCNVYTNCCVRNMFTYLRGKLYICPFIGNAMNLKAVPQNEMDYLDVEETMKIKMIAEIKEVFEKKFVGRKYFFSCDYCEGRPILVNECEKIEPYVQVKNARIIEYS